MEVKKPNSSARLSYTPKRSSASSTNYTGTPTSSSRESANLSTATSATSASAGSHRFSFLKAARRNSAGSDISSLHSVDASSRDRNTFSAAGDNLDGTSVPPVPPLPKDLSSYKTPPQSSTSLVFPGSDSVLDSGRDTDKDASEREKSHEYRRSNQISEPSTNKPSSTAHGTHEAGSGVQITPKTPSKKWSFTNPLSMRRSASPNRRELSPSKSSHRKLTKPTHTEKQLRPSSSKESQVLRTISPKSSMEGWPSAQRRAMASEISLASLSSLSSLPEPSPPMSPSQPAGPVPAQREQHSPNRSGTAGSMKATHGSNLDAQVNQGSPTSKLPRDTASKRLTPSSIPFFRRSSSQSIQVPSSATSGVSASPTSSSAPSIHHSSAGTDVPHLRNSRVTSPTTPGASQRKSSMLSLGLPSILKGSASRKTLQVDKGALSSRENEKVNRYRDSENEQRRGKKDDRDRSESRISVLMGRKRGKVRCYSCLV